MTYSLFLERIGRLNEAEAVLSLFLKEEKRISSEQRANFDKRFEQLALRSGRASTEPTTFKTSALIKRRIQALSKRDVFISLILLGVLSAVTLWSTFYKETYEAKLLDLKIEDVVSEDALSKALEEKLPPISEKSVQDVKQLLAQATALRRSQIVIKNGIIGIAAVTSNDQSSADAKTALYEALKRLGEENSGGQFHLRSPTATSLGGLYDYYHAVLILTDDKRQILDTGVKTRTNTHIHWDNQ